MFQVQHVGIKTLCYGFDMNLLMMTLDDLFVRGVQKNQLQSKNFAKSYLHPV